MFEEIFLDIEELKKAEEYVTKNLKAKHDWRNNFLHRRIYNKLNFRLGVLKKVEQARKTLTVSSINDCIKFLYILGYGEKQITYLLFDWGYFGYTLNQVSYYIRRHKVAWEEEKEKLIMELAKAQQEIFQDMRAEVMAVEKRNLTILLKNLELLNDKLEALDPIDNISEFNTVIKQIERLEKRLKDSHGLDELRRSFIKANEQIVIAEGLKRVEERRPENNEPKPDLIQ